MDKIKEALLEERENFNKLVDYYQHHKKEYLFNPKKAIEFTSCVAVVNFIDAFLNKYYIEMEN